MRCQQRALWTPFSIYCYFPSLALQNIWDTESCHISEEVYKYGLLNFHPLLVLHTAALQTKPQHVAGIGKLNQTVEWNLSKPPPTQTLQKSCQRVQLIMMATSPRRSLTVRLPAARALGRAGNCSAPRSAFGLE